MLNIAWYFSVFYWDQTLQFGNIGCLDLKQRLVKRGKPKNKRLKSLRNTKQTTGGSRERTIMKVGITLYCI